MLYVERKFSEDFCKNVAAECLKDINSAVSFNLVSLPGVGISYFLRYLSTRDPKNKFIHINTFEMPEFTKEELFKQMAAKTGNAKNGAKLDTSLNAIKNNLEVLAQTNDKIVVIFNRLDRLFGIFNQNLTDNLRFLKGTSNYNVVYIFVTSNPLIETHNQIVRDGSKVYAKTIYFPMYSTDDLLQIARIDGVNIKTADLAAELSGGHHSLFHTLRRCQDINNPLSDPTDELMVKQLLLSLNARRRDMLRAVVEGRHAKIDDYLSGTGLVKPNGSHGQSKLFTPLLSQYILKQGAFNLPHKERKLLRLLKQNQGKLVRKQDIFDQIWGDEIAGDWALNSLVYRLRRHPAFDANRFAIKSIKKDGYMLVDSSK